MALRARIVVQRITRGLWVSRAHIFLADRTLRSGRFWARSQDGAEGAAETWAVRQLSSHESFVMVDGGEMPEGDSREYGYYLDLTRVADDGFEGIDPGPRVMYQQALFDE